MIVQGFPILSRDSQANWDYRIVMWIGPRGAIHRGLNKKKKLVASRKEKGERENEVILS